MSLYRGQHVELVEYNRKTETYAVINVHGEIVAELKRHEYLSQPQLKQVRHTSGKHRRARAAVYSDPAGQSGFPGQTGAIFFTSAGKFTWFGAPADPEPEKPIPNAGIRAGEVIAYRGWAIKGDRLFSVYKHECEWHPGKPMKGDTREEYGVHAFKDAQDTSEYVDYYASGLGWVYINLLTSINYRTERVRFYAIGKVALWGEIVEHERGYRAEFCKVLSIDSTIGPVPPGTIDRLRARYALSSPVGKGEA